MDCRGAVVGLIALACGAVACAQQPTAYPQAPELSSQQYLDRARRHYAERNFDRAFEDARHAIDRDPNNPAAWDALESLFDHVMDADGDGSVDDPEQLAALWRLLERNIERQPTAQLYAFRGRLYERLAETQLAIDDLSKAIELDPMNPTHWGSRATCYFDAGEIQRAVADLQSAIELDAGLGIAWYLRGMMLAELKSYDQAIEHLTKALSLGVDKARLGRAGSQLALGQYDAALNDFDHLLQADARSVDALVGRAAAYQGLGKHRQAVDDLQLAAQWSTEPSAKLMLVWCYSTSPDDDVRDGAKALALAKTFEEPRDGRALVVLAAAHAESQDFDAAIQLLRQALDLDREDDELQQRRRELLRLYEMGNTYHSADHPWTPKIGLRYVDSVDH